MNNNEEEIESIEEESTSTKTLHVNLASRPDIAQALKNGIRVIQVEIEDQMIVVLVV